MSDYVNIDVDNLEGYTDEEIINLINGVENRIKECQETNEKLKLEEILEKLKEELTKRGNTGNGEGSDGEPECDGSASGVDGDDEPDCDMNNPCDDDPVCEYPENGDEDCNEEPSCWCDGIDEDTPEDGKEEDKDEKPTENEKKTFKLSDAYSDSSIIDKIRIVGWYTGTEGNISNTTRNRCKAVAQWLGKKFNIESIVTEFKHGGTEPSDIHSEDAVKSRRVDVYVVYKGDAIDKGSSSDNKKDTKKEDKPSVMYDYSTENDGFSVYNEAEYFSTLSETDAVRHQLIKDKIKNFNPAFHSITPEGFAMRLNFLHGCTRQGPTLEGNQSNNVATNLAFGRPPVCVLRIGDFINTRMIIRTLSINYESGSGIQWDLNPEGAGIQPMFAKVQMGIDLIGGQSLDEPVRQLNNALNGLHYANSGVINERKKKFVVVTDDMTVNEFGDKTINMSQAEYDKLVDKNKTKV